MTHASHAASDDALTLPRLPRRSNESHKSSIGSVLVVAGSVGYAGAAYLTAKAALRAGAGLVVTACPDAIAPILATKHTCVMVRPFASTAVGSLSKKAAKEIIALARDSDAVALGPGLGRDSSTEQLAREITLSLEGKLVLDADGLNAFEGRADVLAGLHAEAVLTPHAGEFARLVQTTTKDIQADRERAARNFARSLEGVLVLKGHHTLVVERLKGQHKERVHVNKSGSDALATAGSGDVLTGIIASLLAQGLGSWDAARLGVYLHGRAGEHARRKLGGDEPVPVIATDVLEAIPHALAEQMAAEGVPAEGELSGSWRFDRHPPKGRA